MTVESLQGFGLRVMDEDEIRAFIESESVGILGLAGDDMPCLRPLSYGFDGDGTVYLPFVGGADSSKRRLAERTGRASFLIFHAETPYTWRSVHLTGALTLVPAAEHRRVSEEIAIAWRPAIFEDVDDTVEATLYALDFEEQSGVKHVGLPDGLEA